MNKEVNFKVVLTNEVEHMLMGEPKLFTLYVVPTNAAPYKIHNMEEHELPMHMAEVMSSVFKV